MKEGKSQASSRAGDNRLAVKKQTKKEKQAAKDPNKPKRAARRTSGRRTRKNTNNKSVAAVGKAAGDEWKSMSAEDKAPYVAISEKRKAEYERQMKAYNKKLAGEEDEESDKSKSEVNDDEDEEGSVEVSEEEDDD